MLTQERLKEVLNYDESAGVFVWRISSRNVKKDSIAGTDCHGYRLIRVEGKLYGAHRLTWLYVNGYFPEHNIDHINRVRNDNRIVNLREVSQSCNMRNSGTRKDNTSGVKGICFHKPTSKWQAKIKINKKDKYLGCYTDFDEAVCARLAAEQCENWSGCDASSPAYQHVCKLQGKG